ncbi:hypothetical protein EYF80_057758 [Liparis tanakae]|uniref:Uncharacterized protein n=1 Tax=Liparis tanakae TaxID=230148 RepID=A0A4Z2ETF8_9TELE|nr:hypothetical protein EYF80_057758 [Liparis tanakae]
MEWSNVYLSREDIPGGSCFARLVGNKVNLPGESRGMSVADIDARESTRIPGTQGMCLLSLGAPGFHRGRCPDRFPALLLWCLAKSPRQSSDAASELPLGSLTSLIPWAGNLSM